jgi:hypothetical protein
MAPVVHALEAHPNCALVLVTGQQRTQLDRMLTIFGLRADADLDVMTERQTLPDLLARIVPAAAERLRALRPDYVLVHGDTLTTFAVALAAFYEGVPVGHVEAGLRSHDLAQPFPEEANRRLTDVLTDLDLPPTPLARGTCWPRASRRAHGRDRQHGGRRGALGGRARGAARGARAARAARSSPSRCTGARTCRAWPAWPRRSGGVATRTPTTSSCCPCTATRPCARRCGPPRAERANVCSTTTGTTWRCSRCCAPRA